MRPAAAAQPDRESSPPGRITLHHFVRRPRSKRAAPSGAVFFEDQSAIPERRERRSYRSSFTRSAGLATATQYRDKTDERSAEQRQRCRFRHRVIKIRDELRRRAAALAIREHDVLAADKRGRLS
jgi:hypothetical protein